MLPKDVLELSEDKTSRLKSILEELYQPHCPPFWEEEKIMVPVDDGAIRVIHIKPENSEGKRPIVFIPGWGTSIIIHGLRRGIFSAPSLAVLDPMNEIWFSKWVIRYIVPLTPVWFWGMIKTLLKHVLLFGMKEKVQKARTGLFIDGAETWKWVSAGRATVDFHLPGDLEAVKDEVWVFNGSGDRIHDQRLYPHIAKHIPRGRFFYMKTQESDREKLMGYIALELSRVTGDRGIPPSLAGCEKNLSL